MLSDWEIAAHADQFISAYGFDAPMHAACVSEILLEKGDLDRARDWNRITRRLNEILEDRIDLFLDELGCGVLSAEPDND